jgi:hypothetical protein
MSVITETQITMAAQNVTANTTLSSWRNIILYGNTCTYLQCAISFQQVTPLCCGLKAWAHKMCHYCDRYSAVGTRNTTRIFNRNFYAISGLEELALMCRLCRHLIETSTAMYQLLIIHVFFKPVLGLFFVIEISLYQAKGA